MKRLLAASASAVIAMTGTTLLASPAEAAPLFTGGLVNVTITDVIDGDVLSNNNVAVGVAANVAATVCDVNVGGILGQLRDTGQAVCTTTADGYDLVISQ